MKKISEGAEAVIYESEVMGLNALIKDRVPKRYRNPKLDSEIRSQRTKSEARILAKASANGIPVPKILMLNENQIFVEKLEGKTLNLLLKNRKVSEKIFAEAGMILAQLHSIDIVHGDYTPANIFVGSKGVSVIDFGLGSITTSVEEKALDLILMKRSVGKKYYSAFESSYRKSYKDAASVIQRLKEIEIRGRYQSRTLSKA